MHIISRGNALGSSYSIEFQDNRHDFAEYLCTLCTQVRGTEMMTAINSEVNLTSTLLYSLCIIVSLFKKIIEAVFSIHFFSDKGCAAVLKRGILVAIETCEIWKCNKQYIWGLVTFPFFFLEAKGFISDTATDG